MLCRLASNLLYKLAETDPPPLKWFPRELAMLASTRLLERANAPPPRHKGTNPADMASRDWFIIKSGLYACKELNLKPTRNRATARDLGCSIVAELWTFQREPVDEVWAKRSRFGIA